MNGHVAQSVAHPMCYPIVEECGAESSPDPHPFHCWARVARPWAHSRLFPSLLAQRWE